MEEKIKEILAETGAVLSGHFLLSSGKHSGGYVQCAKVLRFPDKAEVILKPVAEKLKEMQIDKIVGPAMGGILVAYELGRQLGIEAIFTERTDGVMSLRRGFELKKGDRVVISEDVLTTGKSTLETRKVLEAYGAEVVAVASIIDRRGESMLEDLPVISAVSYQFSTYEKEDCPLCRSGMEVVKPGSRTIF
ncbi:MAG TPA: orotate phosphoribosyltransferase [Proteiniclasticum sp.]|jgi:orotate phosphoribosyltransferase|uniref:orotate phosphoribosyltransferase n=1 Tax=Proteiniclasticum TaxID=1155385 RepID=UPI000E896FB3|nr:MULTISPECIES: orotate phosphoribosyltransferase [Proteiniclasticum]HBW13839.1 orotate phosphoribosyltransferase [Proteiniclasticum sp.]